MFDLIRLMIALYRHRGGVALEYGLSAGAVHTLGTTVDGVFTSISGASW